MKMRVDKNCKTAGAETGPAVPRIPSRHKALRDFYPQFAWRENGFTRQRETLEVSTHAPGHLGTLAGKRVYTHTNNDATPDATNDFTYTYDAVGNVIAVYNANSTGRGNELYYFSQDAFGNELSNDGNLPAWQQVNLLGGSQWGTARTAGITEHQTGKWIDPFTGLYYFHARWLDATVGRFVGRDLPQISRGGDRLVGGNPYRAVKNNPLFYVDMDGHAAVSICFRKIKGHPIVSALTLGHCFLRLEDNGNTFNCGINPSDGNPQPEPDNMDDLSVSCEITHVVSYECVRKALIDQERNRDAGRGTPGFGGNYNAITNNCCHGVREALDRCRGDNGEKLDEPRGCSNCPIDPNPSIGPPEPPCKRQPEDPDPNAE